MSGGSAPTLLGAELVTFVRAREANSVDIRRSLTTSGIGYWTPFPRAFSARRG